MAPISGKKNLQGKVFAVTGASEGIGRALCLQLAREKTRLVLAARNQERLQSLHDDVVSLGSEALAVPTDVTREKDCEALIQKTIERFGRLDVLVNNAGGTMWAPFEELQSLDLFENLMRQNYLSCVYCTYHALPHLKASRGLIVAVSSLAGLTGVPCRTAYAATKHALFGFFDSLRIELIGTGVDITLITPDFVKTEIHRRAIGHDGTPLGKSPMQEDKIMTAEVCAAHIVKAIRARKRLSIPSRRGKLIRWARLLIPGWVDRKAAQAIRERK